MAFSQIMGIHTASEASKFPGTTCPFPENKLPRPGAPDRTDRMQDTRQCTGSGHTEAGFITFLTFKFNWVCSVLFVQSGNPRLRTQSQLRRTPRL